MIRIITLYNKPDLVKEAIASVEAQTRRDFVHIVQEDKGRDWGDCYPPAVFFNEQAWIAHPEDYLCWLSDDDLFLPNYVADLAGYLDANPALGCVYGGAEQYLCMPPAEPRFHRAFLAEQVFDRRHEAAGVIDGGQIMVRRSILDRISYPYAPEKEMARCSDGVLMNKIATVAGIYPVKTLVLRCRTTPLSANVCTTDGLTVTAVEWSERRWMAGEGSWQ